MDTARLSSLVLEEGQNLVKNEYWKKRIDNFIMQIRRKNGLIIFVTPDAKYFRSETDSIDKQSATKIYLSNDAATDEDHQNLTVAERKWIRNVRARPYPSRQRVDQGCIRSDLRGSEGRSVRLHPRAVLESDAVGSDGVDYQAPGH